MKDTRLRGTLLLALTAILVIGSFVPASAQEDSRRKGDRACAADASRLCKKFLEQGDMVILQCFQQNRTKLSRHCHRFLAEVGQLR